MQHAANKKYVLLSVGIAGLILVSLVFLFSDNDFRVGESVYFGERKVATSTDAHNTETQTVVGNAKVYKNSFFGFAIHIPASSNVTSFEDGEGNSVLVSVSDYKMQIYVSSFDEDVALTIARIKKDIPDMKMENPIEITTAGVPTVAFVSRDRGNNREIWFVRGGLLYQILAPADKDDITATIMQSWVWN